MTIENDVLKQVIGNVISRDSYNDLNSLFRGVSPSNIGYVCKKLFKDNSFELNYVCRYFDISASEIPSRILSDGTKCWYDKEKKEYREDGPRHKLWRVDRKLHRVDGPALEYADGLKEWYINGELHRLDGPAVEWNSGTKEWYLNDKRHREDGPAYEGADGTKAWSIEGKLHREDGPAYEGANGTKEWWINGKKYSEEEFNKTKSGR